MPRRRVPPPDDAFARLAARQERRRLNERVRLYEHLRSDRPQRPFPAAPPDMSAPLAAQRLRSLLDTDVWRQLNRRTHGLPTGNGGGTIRGLRLSR